MGEGERARRREDEFRAVDGGTEVVLTYEEIGPFKNLSTHENVEGYAEGWPSALEKLNATLTAP